MEPELAAPEAVESMQAAPVAGAGSEKEREKSALLSRMDGTGEPEEGLEEAETEEPVQPEAPVEDAAEAREAELAAARSEARQAVAREFPEALAEGSELFEACREELEYLREAQSPLAEDPQAEYKIARRMARMLGHAQRPPVPETPKAAPRRKIRPMPAGNAPVEPPATTLERRVAGAKSTGDMLELMREIGTPFEALLRRN
ncbi:MAG: hypothetical protein PHQ12_06770 [Chthoniobacteraceae bacterium]|nr:hypothetical protein [Chthoniobacteraceae bacterium]